MALEFADLSLFSIAPLKWPGVLTTIVAGAIIGLERQIRGKPIGIRTAALICLGTYVFIAMSVSVGNGVTDPSRVIGQVITGIGFLGAGVILSRDGMVLGVTSAAAIWVLAAIGVMIGLDKYGPALLIAFVVVGVLVGVDVLENSFHSLRKGVHRRLNDRRYQKKRDD
ncbi:MULTISPECIES: MgtC/SapB family protein [Zhongshania]|jgi:putative Mg2+ transporter-C (MgtC) family protein|uniref:Protein MgtC n=1 Tax=Zhongshania antarctica TaxID=641702 RepID=A0A840R5K1_9GAMM|nr:MULTISPECIES: MgtC/SapB family protein [Zhongshania]MBB5187692.1 putative Mg2+ transporter-C (MgtC) family protein [Zhongshania antarctica]